MSLTEVFFIVSMVLSIFFAISFFVLFIYYLVIYNRVNKNFRAVTRHDQSAYYDYHPVLHLDVSGLGFGYPMLFRAFLDEAQ